MKKFANKLINFSPEIETTASAINVQSILQNIINTTPTPVSEDIQRLIYKNQFLVFNFSK